MDFICNFFKTCSCSEEERKEEDINQLNLDVQRSSKKSLDSQAFDAMNINPTLADTPVVVKREPPLVPQELIRNDEDWVDFSKNGLLLLLDQLVEDKQWNKIYDKSGTTIESTDGSKFTYEFLLGRTRVLLEKKAFKGEISLKELYIYLYDIEHRGKWDSNVKAYKILEEGDNYSAFHMHYASPIFFISERDLVDKKIHFDHEGKIYIIITSVDNKMDPLPDVVRCKTYLNSVVLSEDANYFYYEGLNQLDAKTLVPEKLLNGTLPFKISEYFRNLTKYINSDLEIKGKQLGEANTLS